MCYADHCPLDLGTSSQVASHPDILYAASASNHFFDLGRGRVVNAKEHSSMVSRDWLCHRSHSTVNSYADSALPKA